ncbi:DUF3817 domain-containing protein [Wielerella bovis]|uniref:DUF3817 domain-containing protein n=1 Tax=Wielerella bovis TaxID=2917790 RepID=UPI00201A0B68|nr:DUF3817 domain-containing protein [Wielerella bovis]ULJ59946.1 DUF3817 domain-containing protein [Wielerella bovis]ULJ65405.1 DUF3817 domain-containing protein [Wielerella bovis]ULJ67750.1 DUF3817 domain-containing protein [Wielerella bovis]
MKILRMVGFAEGVSFLLLTCVAMPMKYMFNNGALVPYVGMAHGVLFLAFVVVLLMTCHRKNWSIMWFLAGLLAAVLPFGTFVFDWKIRQLEQN